MSAAFPVLALLALAVGAPASAGLIEGSPLALASAGRALEAPTFSAGSAFAAGRGIEVEAGPLLAQRAITREWGYSDDSTYVEIVLPGYRSEGWAMLGSALVPGAGHLYVGENSAWIFALAEASGWIARAIFRQRAEDGRDESRAFAGSPEDPGSNWSFTRYAQTTGQDTLALQQLYSGDRDAFYHLVGFDDRYAAGWKPGSEDTRGTYQGLEKDFQRHFKRARYATGALVLNHVVAAVDAFRAARVHNIPLQRDLRLKLGGSIGGKGGAMSLVLERKF